MIVGVDQQRVDDYDDLYNAFDTRQAGDRVKLSVRRDNRIVEVETVLAAVP